MSENYFSPEPVRNFDENSELRIKFVRNLKKGSHVHVLGACGTGTGSLLCLLKTLGFYVTGSDKAFYPPMAEFIKEYADVLYEQFSIENIRKKPDLVVIGNAISRGNVEVEEVLNQKIPFCSMPELLSSLLIQDREVSKTSIVVTGTHGKTTTTALIAHVLSALGKKPGYFFGGVPTGDTLLLPIKPTDDSLSAEERITVIEGDEYDSAFFAKYSKFHCYRPDILIITNIEFDHGDIFPSIEDIEKEFKGLLSRVPESGYVIACADSITAKKVVDEFLTSNSNPPNIIWYGKSSGVNIHLNDKQVGQENSGNNFIQKLTYNVNQKLITLNSALTGNHNALNIAAVLGVLTALNIDLELGSKAIATFSHVKRRQQIHINNSKLVLIEDFAHHPTEVICTLEGIREAFPDKQLIALFEPRSNTSRKAFFKDEYVKGLSFADRVYIKQVDTSSTVYSGVSTNQSFLDTNLIVSDLEARGVKAATLLTPDEIFDEVTKTYLDGSVIVVMSNGDFGGLIKKLEDWGKKI